MTRSIILHVEVDDPSPLALATLAEDCADACERAGIAVTAAAPWDNPAPTTTTLIQSPPDLNQPPPLF